MAKNKISKRDKSVLSTSKQINYLYNLEAKSIRIFCKIVEKYTTFDKNGKPTLNIPKPKQ